MSKRGPTKSIAKKSRKFPAIAPALTEGQDQHETCAICLDPITDPASRVHLDGCGHSFHGQCAVNALRRDGRCPLCRGTSFPEPAEPTPVATPCSGPPVLKPKSAQPRRGVTGTYDHPDMHREVHVKRPELGMVDKHGRTRDDPFWWVGSQACGNDCVPDGVSQALPCDGNVVLYNPSRDEYLVSFDRFEPHFPHGAPDEWVHSSDIAYPLF